MNFKQVIGLVLLALGVILGIFVVQSMQSVSQTIMKKVTGKYSAETMWYLCGAIAMVVGGAAMAIFCRNKK